MRGLWRRRRGMRRKRRRRGRRRKKKGRGVHHPSSRIPFSQSLNHFSHVVANPCSFAFVQEAKE